MAAWKAAFYTGPSFSHFRVTEKNIHAALEGGIETSATFRSRAEIF